jgi:hypothetical protein
MPSGMTLLALAAGSSLSPLCKTACPVQSGCGTINFAIRRPLPGLFFLKSNAMQPFPVHPAQRRLYLTAGNDYGATQRFIQPSGFAQKAQCVVEKLLKSRLEGLKLTR